MKRQAHIWPVVGFSPMDPDDLLTQSWKWQRATWPGIPAEPITEDLLFPVRDCQPEQQLIKNSELRVIDDVLGHLGLFGWRRPA